MRLTKWQVEILSFEIARDLLKAGLVATDAERLERLAHEVITDDMAAIDKLDAEVVEILKTHATLMRQQGVDYATMYEKVKKQLIRERKLVL